jgi:hypothetical protein
MGDLMRTPLLVTVLACSLIAPDADALRIDGPEVVVPMIGRLPGANGTIWRTDLFIANAGGTQFVTLAFHPTGLEPIFIPLSLQPNSSVSFRDVVKETFGLENGAGLLVVRADESFNPPARIEARAQVYNIGSAVGEFGQAVPGIVLSQLGDEAFVHGLSGIEGNRLNVGVASPNDHDVPVLLRLLAGDHSVSLGRQLTLRAYESLQINDVFSLSS